LSIRQFLVGLTHQLSFEFRDDDGDLTPVDNPVVNIYTPDRSLYLASAALTTTSVVGAYTKDFYVASGLTYGHWYGLGIGTTNSVQIFSEANPFEIFNPIYEPFWVGLTEFRDYLELPDDDHTRDNFLKQCLQAGLELCEGYCQRRFGVRDYSETFDVQDTDRVRLTNYPVVGIVGITATTNTVTGANLELFYRLDSNNGILRLINNVGFDAIYDGVLLAIDYRAGFATIPEPVRQAAFALGSALVNLASSEGISTIKLSDLSFALSRKLFSGHIGEILTPYRNMFRV
jgi:hypothetical protein